MIRYALIFLFSGVLFAGNLRDYPAMNWNQFNAVGYTKPVFGVIYRASDNKLVVVERQRVDPFRIGT